MNGEWIFQVVLVVGSAILGSALGYFLGIRSQKIQALQNYITEMVEENYPLLFDEIRRNSGLLDNYLENPFVSFQFPKLEEIWHKGYSGVMNTHHGDLFLLVASYRKNIRPRLKEFHNLQVATRKKIFEIWDLHLLKSGLGLKSERIAEDLVTVINPFNVVSLLLRERYGEVRNKIEGCVVKRASPKKRKEIDLDEISQSLIEKAKSEITNSLRIYRELKKQNDEDVKGKLLLMLQKYISNPVS